MNELQNQIAVVTGAGRGIGRAIALKFAAAGADVVCVSRTAENSEKVAAEVRALTVPALRAHEQRQVVEACGLMADRRPAGAAWELLQLRDLAVTDTLEAWVAAVEAEMREVAR